MKLITTVIKDESKWSSYTEEGFYFFKEEEASFFNEIFGITPKLYYGNMPYSSIITETFDVEATPKNMNKRILFIFDNGTYRWLPYIVYKNIKKIIEKHSTENVVYYRHGYIQGTPSPFYSKKMMSANNYNGYQFWQRIGIK